MLYLWLAKLNIFSNNYAVKSTFGDIFSPLDYNIQWSGKFNGDA